MRMILVPGYSELFEGPYRDYADWLVGIPSEVVISVFIMLNNELNTPEEDRAKQQRLLNIVSERYTPEQVSLLQAAYNRFYAQNGPYQLFGRRYLMAALVEELKRNHPGNDLNTTPEQEFRIFMAYLSVVDRLNNADEESWKIILSGEGATEYMHVWPTFIDQFEFNHQTDGGFEFMKLLCFCRYSLQHLKPYLKEYIEKLGFSNLSTFLAANKQLADTTLAYHPEKQIRKFTFIVPQPHVDRTYLEASAINPKAGDPNLKLGHLRQFPLYENRNREFIIQDEDFFRKKIYRGPFFEIYHQTSLKKEKNFNQHCTDISLGTMEELFFRALCQLLSPSKHQVLHFDDNSQSQPDCYARLNKNVVLIEFKDYLFKEALILDPDYETIKNYIDEKFVQSPAGKPKGITQLANQLTLLQQQQFQFDPGLNALLQAGKRVNVYPIVCFSDFMFSMPGVNKYLNEEFQTLQAQEVYPNLVIQPLTLVNLQTLYDFALRGGDLISFAGLTARYSKILEKRQQKNKTNPSVDHYLSARAGFDAVYQSVFLKEMLSRRLQRNRIEQLRSLIGLTQADIDANL